MLDDIWTTVNWLAITIPIFVAAGVYNILTEGWKWPQPMALVTAAIVAAVCFVGLYFLYPIVGFPAWMGWPHEWFGSS